MPPGATAARAWRPLARVAGAEDPKRMTPPAPAATSAVTDAMSVSSTGTTRVCSASRVRLQVASTRWFVQTLGVGVGAGEPVGAVVGLVEGLGLVPVPGSAQAARIDVAAMTARSPGVVLRIRVIRSASPKGADPPFRRAARTPD